MTEQKKTRASKKSTVKKAEVKPTLEQEQEQEPSNRNSTRSVADIPAGEGYLGNFGSKNRKDPGVDGNG